MTQLSLPNGTVIDFEDASEDQIGQALSKLKESQPELFEERPEPINLGTASFEEIQKAVGAGREPEEAPEYQPSNEGEVSDTGFQFFYGRADSIGDKAKRLEATFGPGTFKQVEGTDKFTLLLDNISPELKKEYGLPETGDMYVNKPGFSWYDVAGFGGAEAVPLATALGAGLVFSGVGLIPGMAIMAAAGASGKAFDELIIEDRIEKMNTQADDEVYGNIALTGAFYGLGEGLGRGLFAVGRRLIEGPGPRPDPNRIEQIVATGVGRAAATRIAREEAKTELRAAVKAGAAPTVQEVSQKAILGRMQSIYEGIFPNAKAAAKNLDFVKTTLGRLSAGEIDDATAKSLLKQQTDSISAQVSRAMKMADVDESVRLANRHLQEVIENEFKVLLDLYDPKVPLRAGWQDAANLSARLFEQDSAILYKKSEDFLAKVIDPSDGTSAATFSNETLKKVVKGFELDDALSAISGNPFASGLFKYIKETPQFSMTELTSLRSALRSAGRDPNLMPGITDSAIGRMVQGIDDTINNRLEGLAYLRAGGRKTAEKMGLKTTWDDATAQSFEDGILAWKKAQNFHAKGIDRFKSFSQSMLERDIRSGVALGDKDVLNRVVEAGNPGKLLGYLKSITPSGRAAEGIQTVSKSVFDDAAAAANRGEFKAANKILDDAGVSDEIVKRLPAFAEKLGPDDAFGRVLASDFSNTIRSLGKMAEARANPLQYRNAIRDSLSREWMEQTFTSSKVAGEFSPTVFASRFEQLGVGVQNTLFGKQNATAMRQLMKDYHKVGMSNKAFASASAEALGATAQGIRARALGLTGGRSISDEIAGVQAVMREAERQSDDALFQAFAKGQIDDADSLVLNLLKNPGNYDRLVRQFGAQLDGPAGVKDMVMGRVMEAAFPDGIIPERVASGAWGAPMRRQITNLNRNGALAKILGDGDQAVGQGIVNDLIKASKIGERISDQALKGKQGLASAAFAAGAGMRLITNPLAFIGEAAGIFAMGRVMRQKWFLNSLLQPRYSAGLGILSNTGGRRLLQQGRRAGADLDGVSPLGLELRERVAQETRAVVASLAAQQADEDTRKAAAEFVETNIRQPISQLGQQAAPVIQDIRQQIPDAAAAAQQMNPLRQVERNKLLGIGANQ